MNDITEVDRLNAKIADLERTIEWLQGRTGILMGAKENAVQQAQQWAQEARAQRATVLSILNRFGLPENDWEAKRLIVKHVEKLIGATIPPGPVVADQASEVIAAAQGAPTPTEHASGLPRLIELLNAIKPNFGDVGSRDVEVKAQRERIEEAIAILSAAQPGAEPDVGGAACEDEIVGHKTFSIEGGGFRHEPLRRGEADAIMAQVEASKRRRTEMMPDELTARRVYFDAWLRLKELGWNEAIYCSKDGSEFEVIEAGSTGVHRCVYQGEWPSGSWWILDDGDMCPSRPVLYRRISETAIAPVPSAK